MSDAYQSLFRVLLVEDDPADAGLTRRAVKESRFPCEIRHAKDGVEALEFLRDGGTPRPDLILLDLNMPRMDGREVLAALKADPRLTTIPVVVLTTSDIEADVEASYLHGANSFVTKPMGIQDFFDIIGQISSYWFQTVKLPR